MILNSKKINMKIFVLLFTCFILHKCQVSGNKNSKTNGRLQVCVIGAGGAGLSAARHLTDYQNKFNVTVFEKTSKVGGTWVYSDKTGKDEHGYPIHSSMYKHLRTNVPKEIMNFPSWPKINYNRSIMPHEIVQEYLNNYTDFFHLKQFIQFDTVVLRVSLVETKPSEKWSVVIKNLNTYEISAHIFDAVVVCNGHYFQPSIPKIKGLENFEGRVLHSHEYREPEQFTNKKVIILGAGSSGVDIGQEIVNYTTTTYLSFNKEKFLPDSMGLVQVKGVDKFQNGAFVLKDNSTITADVLLLCTGYQHSFPFLDESTGIKVDDNYVSPLYKHVINVNHPSMSFVGVSFGIIPFPMFEAQARFITAYLRGDMEIPPKDVMMVDAEYRSARKKDAHKLINSWIYTNDLAYLAKFDIYPDFYRYGYDRWISHWHSNWADFKDYDLIIESDQKNVKIVKH